MKKVFALLTIVTVLGFVACKNKPAHDDAADSARRADSIKRYNDSVEAAAKMNETPATTDSPSGDSATMNNGTTTGTTTTGTTTK